MLAIQMALTAPLWGHGHFFPQIPLWAAWNHPTIAVGEMVVIVLSGAGILWILAAFLQKFRQSPRTGILERLLWGVTGVALLTAMLDNQHRIQAWAVQFLLYAVCFSLLRPAMQIHWLRWITISIYFFSAVSKLDASFLNSHGQTMLDGILQLARIDADLPPALRSGIALSIPAFELLTAFLLLWSRTRRIGWYCSLLMHSALILVLGPFGLNHHLPVLIWNFFFILQNSLLFGRGADIVAADAGSCSDWSWNAATYARIVLTGCLLFPVSEWFNVGDVWPSWGLYASRGAKVNFYLRESALEKIPRELQAHCFRTAEYPEYVRVDLYRWSFAETNAPPYPEDRFLIGVSSVTIRKYDLESDFVLVHHGTASRWSGQRSVTMLDDFSELQSFSDRFWFNASQGTLNDPVARPDPF
ncbi:MauE/DoxX family redox-associated membrane protein [Rubinisphaera margarita]|uniref:MauE/DoxX family redox-associated membrane protein n=1 Tax=Rubinisphaera margarita TaxID=2909586 RepID=UPI001EE9A94F|nr:MauE/DoxX family redox-associated membrane protein [Rubinisphaera margarita]MCG6156617.1 hypothetical protein [Rubinisphaera margarita]